MFESTNISVLILLIVSTFNYIKNKDMFNFRMSYEDITIYF